MTRIAIVTDSHNNKVNIERFIELCRREKYDLVIHLGDFAEDAHAIERALGGIAVLNVAGNCDFFSRDDEQLVYTCEQHRMLLVHGHNSHVKYGLTQLSYQADSEMCKIALYGHTHIPFIGYVGDVLMINPGALQNGHYCELELTPKDIIPINKTL